jgi:hypothetical protein
MRTTMTIVVLLLLGPSISLAGRYHGYRPDSSYSSSSGRYGNHYRHSNHHGDDWIVPLAIVGGILGVVALSQMSAPAPPPPPQRLCRDTYNYYDAYGNYLYARYVDRPCY